MNLDVLENRDPRRIKRIIRLLRQQYKTFPVHKPSPTFNWCVGGVINANYQTMPEGFIVIEPRHWRKIHRDLLRQARRMGLPRYPSQAAMYFYELENF